MIFKSFRESLEDTEISHFRSWFDSIAEKKKKKNFSHSNAKKPGEILI